MKRIKQLLTLFLLSGVVFCFFGCATYDDETRENAVPWNEPASWEGQFPGMGG